MKEPFVLPATRRVAPAATASVGWALCPHMHAGPWRGSLGIIYVLITAVDMDTALCFTGASCWTWVLARELCFSSVYLQRSLHPVWSLLRGEVPEMLLLYLPLLFTFLGHTSWDSTLLSPPCSGRQLSSHPTTGAGAGEWVQGAEHPQHLTGSACG